MRRFDCSFGRRRSTKRCRRRTTSSTSTRSSTTNGGGSAALRTVTSQSPISTAPVASSVLAVPSGRARTVPRTCTTYSLRTSTVPGITHWMTPVKSRTSMNARCSPCSRRRATQPQTVTSAPTWSTAQLTTPVGPQGGRSRGWRRVEHGGSSSGSGSYVSGHGHRGNDRTASTTSASATLRCPPSPRRSRSETVPPAASSGPTMTARRAPE